MCVFETRIAAFFTSLTVSFFKFSICLVNRSIFLRSSSISVSVLGSSSGVGESVKSYSKRLSSNVLCLEIDFYRKIFSKMWIVSNILLLCWKSNCRNWYEINYRAFPYPYFTKKKMREKNDSNENFSTGHQLRNFQRSALKYKVDYL